jgi:hypothetical protein
MHLRRINAAHCEIATPSCGTVRNDTEIFFRSRRTMLATMTDFYLQVFPDSSGNNL